MKILILYFSGTGNTYFIAELIMKKLLKKGYNAELFSVENFNPAYLCKYDLLVFGYPVYGYAMPSFLNKYIEKLSLPTTKAVILFSTMGYYGGNSLRDTAGLFKKNGFLTVGFEEFKLPGSDGLLIIKKNSNKIKKLLNKDFKNSKLINSSVENIVNIVEGIFKNGVNEKDIKLPKLKLTVFLLKPLINIIFIYLEGLMKRNFKVNDNCINCGICEDICPSNNIVIKNGKVEFLDKCYVCLRCIHQCPVEAIQIGKITREKLRYKGPEANYKPERVLKRYNLID